MIKGQTYKGITNGRTVTVKSVSDYGLVKYQVSGQWGDMHDSLDIFLRDYRPEPLVFNTWAEYMKPDGHQVHVTKVTDRSIVFNYDGEDKTRRMSPTEFLSHHVEVPQ